jgi:preprotein translocase subunit SecY
VSNPIPNLFKVPELKEKLLFTLLCLVIYRIGAHIATPGVNVDALADFLSNAGQGTLFQLYDLFAGGGFSRATVFALGIMPYISASIVFQLAGPVFPVIEKMQRDEEGKKTLTQWTRYLTVVLCVFQAYGFAIFTEQLPGAVALPGWGFRMTTVLTLTTGGVFVMWLGEQITERGIGNGMSLLIFFSIIERILPETLRTFEALKTGTLSFPILLVVLTMMVFVVAGTVAVTVASRRIPVQIPRKVMGRGRRDADHLRAIAHHRPRNRRDIHRHAVAEGRRRSVQHDVGLVHPRERRADHILRLLLHVHHLQSGGPGGESEEAGRVHPRREARRGDGRLHR